MAEYSGNIVDVLTSDFAREIYGRVKDLPVVDYHCHLSPEEIHEDKPFENIGQMWLAGDHYKWRLMRAAGIDEEYITGGRTWKEKFDAFCKAVSLSPGNPVWDWTAMELEKFFGVTLPFLPANADRIWEECNAVIAREKLSPRKAIAMNNVEYIATTDDPCDDLKYHKLLKEEGYGVKVAPSFRTDNVVGVDKPAFAGYVKKLEKAVGRKIAGFADYKEAIRARLDYFCSLGCKFSDVGVEGFPAPCGGFDEAELDETFKKLAAGEYTVDGNKLRYALYVFLAREYEKRGMVMQLHLCVTRNSNAAMYGKCGADSGFDCVGENISVPALRAFFNEVTSLGGLPRTIVYSLNPTLYYELITLCGAFRGVVPGISWWFNDHKRGITELLAAAAELSCIDSLVGMLTDSRSFLSYPRHDYFRRILCEFLSKVTPEAAKECAVKVAEDLSYFNARKLVEDKI